ncbi:MAG: hypothetical protein WAK29_09880, partial [Terriglobales bacterium]
LHHTWPLTVDISLLFNPDGSGTQTTTINQYFETEQEATHNGKTTSFGLVQNRVTPTDTLEFASGFVVTGNENQSSAQRYFAANSTGYCYSRSIAAAANVLTSITNGVGCR